jgi:hypothetical protein
MWQLRPSSACVFAIVDICHAWIFVAHFPPVGQIRKLEQYTIFSWSILSKLLQLFYFRLRPSRKFLEKFKINFFSNFVNCANLHKIWWYIQNKTERLPVILLQIPSVTSNTNCYFKYQLLLQIPIVTSNTNCYFKYQLVLRITISTSNTMSNDPTRWTRRTIQWL